MKHTKENIEASKHNFPFDAPNSLKASKGDLPGKLYLSLQFARIGTKSSELTVGG